MAAAFQTVPPAEHVAEVTSAAPFLDIAIVSINYAPEPTGIAVYSTGMAEYLAAHGHRVIAYTAFSYYPAWKKDARDEGRIFASESVQGVALRRNYIYVPANPTALRRILHELSFTVSTVLRYAIGRRTAATIVVSPPLLLGTAVGLIAKLKGSKLLLHVQDLQPDAAVDLGMLKPGAITQMLFRIERANYALADRVSSISVAMLRKIEAKGVAPAKTYLFKNWADDDLLAAHDESATFRQMWALEGKFVVLYAGNMGVKQGLSSLIDVAAGLLHEPDVVVVIVGDGGEKDLLVASAKARGLSNVRFKPPVKKAQLGALLAMADVSVIPQKAGVADVVLPSKLGNLLTVGKPIVVAAAADSELAGIVRACGCGIVCQPEDERAMTDALLSLRENPQHCKMMGRRGQAYASQHLAKTQILSAFTAAVIDLVHPQRPLVAPSLPERGASRSPIMSEKTEGQKEPVNKFAVATGWPLATLVRRVLWVPFGILFLRGTTRFLSPLRVVALRLFGAKLARGVLICDGVKVWYPWNLTMHEGATLGPSVEVYNFAPVMIGADAAVSQYSYLCTATHDYTTLAMPLTYRPIVIGDHAWVAAGSFIGPGVSIGAGAVVGARAVVTRDVRAWVVVAGNPAKEIKARQIGESGPAGADA